MAVDGSFFGGAKAGDANIAMAQYLEQTYGVPYHERKARETREGEM